MSGKRFVMILCGILVMCMTGCAAVSNTGGVDDSEVQIGNPVREVTLEELINITGISLPASEEIEDVSYSVIQIDGENPVAQMDFTYQGVEFFLRVQATGELEAGDISGLHYEWEEKEQAAVGYCEATVYLKEDVGYIAWLDIAPGILYNLGVTESADAESLIKAANLVFSPLQGED